MWKEYEELHKEYFVDKEKQRKSKVYKTAGRNSVFERYYKDRKRGLRK